MNCRFRSVIPKNPRVLKPRTFIKYSIYDPYMLDWLDISTSNKSPVFCLANYDTSRLTSLNTQMLYLITRYDLGTRWDLSNIRYYSHDYYHSWRLYFVRRIKINNLLSQNIPEKIFDLIRANYRL